MKKEIQNCWDTFVLLDATAKEKYHVCHILERLHDLTGMMELAYDEDELIVANKCIKKFRRIVKKLVEKN